MPLVGILAGCLFALGSRAPATHAQAGSDIVLVVDVSTSMRALFPEVRERLYHEIDLAHVGDRVVLVTFGEGAHLLARRRVRGPADRAYLRALVQSLEPAQRATYVTLGLDRGFRELESLFAKAPDRERRLLWLSDDKNNPPAVLGDEVLTLADLRDKHDETNPGGEWFAFDAPLAERLGAEVGEFLQWARRSLFYLAVREPNVALGAFPGTALTAHTTVHFVPQHGALAGLEFLVLARVTDANDPGAPPVDVQVEPGTVTVQDAEWAQEFTLTFRGPPGAYRGYLIFESFARKNFQVQPERIPLTLSLDAPKLLPADEPELAELVAKRNAESEEADPAGGPLRLGRANRPLVFGPVQPGKTYSHSVTVRSNTPLTADQVRVLTDIPLPEGISLSTDVSGGGDTVRVRFRLAVGDEVRLDNVLMTGAALTGHVRFQTDEPDMQLVPPGRDLLVDLMATDTLLSRGRRSAPRQAPVSDGPEDRRAFKRLMADALALPETEPVFTTPATPVAPDAPPTIPVTGWWSPRYARPMLGIGGAAVMLLIAVTVVRRRPKATHFFGELVVVRDPGRPKVGNLNLQRVGARSGRDVLLVGRSARADIRLRHTSAYPVHARLLVEAAAGELRIVLDPGRGADVRVNDREVTEARPLRDKDLLALGDYLFLFSAPEPKRRAVVQFVDGSSLEGTPIEWNIAAPAFQLLVEQPTGPDEVAHVKFADLKAVFFVSDDGEVAPGGGGPLQVGEELEVEFPDGDTLTGHALNGYTDHAQRFYLVPTEQSDAVTVLVERANTEAVTRHPPTNGVPERRRSRFLPWT